MTNQKRHAAKWAAISLFNLGCAIEFTSRKLQRDTRYELSLLKRKQRAERRLLALAFSAPQERRRDRSDPGEQTVVGFLCQILFWMFATGVAIILLIAYIGQVR